jgi:hypothetical protein
MQTLGRRFWTVTISGFAFLLVLSAAIYAYRHPRESTAPNEASKTPDEPKCPFAQGGKKPMPKKVGPNQPGKCPHGGDKAEGGSKDDIGNGASVKKSPDAVKISAKAAVRAMGKPSNHGVGGDISKCPYAKGNAGMLQEAKIYSYSSSSASSYEDATEKSKLGIWRGRSTKISKEKVTRPPRRPQGRSPRRGVKKWPTLPTTNHQGDDQNAIHPHKIPFQKAAAPQGNQGLKNVDPNRAPTKCPYLMSLQTKVAAEGKQNPSNANHMPPIAGLQGHGNITPNGEPAKCPFHFS